MVGLEGGKVVDIKGMKGHPVNEGTICTLPANYVPVFEAEGRLSEPLPSDDPTQRQPDITQANEVLSWHPKIALSEGLNSTIEYFRQLLITQA